MYCQEAIPLGVGRCPYCGSILEVSADESDITIDVEEAQDGDAGTEAVQNSQPSPGSESTTVGRPNPTRQQRPGEPRRTSYGLSNGMKVFLTVIFTIIPGFGQLAGIITAIVFMNSEDDDDKKSFGVAILVASLIMFVFACIGCFIMVLVSSSMRNIGPMY